MSADKPGGYGRYKDDPEHVGCPRARTDMTPCVARDGRTAMTEAGGACVGCGERPADLLNELRRVAKRPVGALITQQDGAADKLAKLVREVTEPPAAP